MNSLNCVTFIHFYLYSKKEVTMKCTIRCCCCCRCRCCAKIVNDFGLFGVSIFSPWQTWNNNSKKRPTEQQQTQQQQQTKSQLSRAAFFPQSIFFCQTFLSKPKKKCRRRRRRRKKSQIDDANSISYCMYVVALIWNAQKQSNHFEQPILLILFRYCFFFFWLH